MVGVEQAVVDSVCSYVSKRCSERVDWVVSLTPCFFIAASFSFFHMRTKGARFWSCILVNSKSSNVSINICHTLRSLTDLSRARMVSTNLSSKFLVNVSPGLSVRMRTSIIALYCHDGLEE